MGIEYNIFCKECRVYNDISFKHYDIELAAQHNDSVKELTTDILEFIIYHAIFGRHELFLCDDAAIYDSSCVAYTFPCKEYKGCSK